MPVKARKFSTSTPKATPNSKKKSLVLGEKQWLKIVENSRKFDEKRGENEQDKAMHKFLKTESQAMTAKWKKANEHNLRQKQAFEDKQKENMLTESELL